MREWLDPRRFCGDVVDSTEQVKVLTKTSEPDVGFDGDGGAGAAVVEGVEALSDGNDEGLGGEGCECAAMERSGELEENGEETLGGGFGDFCGEDAEAVVAAAEVAAGPVLVAGAECGAGQGGLLAEGVGTEFALDVLALGHGWILPGWKWKRPAGMGGPFCYLFLF